MKHMLIISILMLLLLGACTSQTFAPAAVPVNTSVNTSISDAAAVVVESAPSASEPTSSVKSSIVDVNLEMFNFGFRQDPVTIKKGDRVRLRVTTSEGTHGLMIPGLGLSTGKLSAGNEEVLEFVADEVGMFEYFCNVPCGSGHRSMKGQLVVEE